MFSLKEDLQILDAVKFRGSKSARQVFRDLVVVMNRSDEAIKTRYKAYLKNLSELDKLTMLNRAKVIDSSFHCVLIHKDPVDGKKKIKQIVENLNAGPPTEKVKPPKQPKSRRSSSKKRVRRPQRKQAKEQKAKVLDPLESIKKNIAELDESNSLFDEEDLKTDENEQDMDPFECKSEMNDQEMTIEQGYDSEIILNSDDEYDQKTISINQTPKQSSSKNVFGSMSSERRPEEEILVPVIEAKEEDKQGVEVASPVNSKLTDEINAKFEIEPARFSNQVKPMINNIDDLLNSPNGQEKERVVMEAEEVVANPFKMQKEEEGVIEGDQGGAGFTPVPTFFKEVERPKLGEKPKSLIERILEKKEKEESEGTSKDVVSSNFNLTTLGFDDIFTSGGSEIQKSAQKKEVNSAEASTFARPPSFNQKFNSSGNEKPLKEVFAASSPYLEKATTEPTKELKRGKGSKHTQT